MAESADRREPILLTGGSGMLGYYAATARFIRPSRKDLDITAPAELSRMFAGTRFSAVLHLAAFTDLEACEQDPQQAYAINTAATESIARLCARYEIPLIYASTAGVFGGAAGGRFSEEDPTNPQTVYAKTKHWGELAVRQHCPEHLIVRIGWLMGGLGRDHKFVGQMLTRLRASRGQPIPVTTDTTGSLLYAQDFFPALWRILRQQRRAGTIHLTNDGSCTRFELARAIRCQLGLDDRDVVLKPVPSSHFASTVPRPFSEVLISNRRRAFGLPPLRHWRAAMEAYLTTWLGL